MSVATDMKTAVIESMMTREGCARCDSSFCEECQGLTGLECRARRILSHYTAIEKRLPNVLLQHTMVLSALLSHHDTWVVGR